MIGNILLLVGSFVFFGMIIIHINMMLKYKKSLKILYETKKIDSDKIDVLIKEKSKLIIEKNTMIVEFDEYKKRVRELEDGINEKFGVSIRQEKTIVNIKFSRLELACFMSGIMLLIRNVKVIEDAEQYVKIYKKIADMAPNVEKEV